jgi:hypothetical protein
MTETDQLECAPLLGWKSRQRAAQTCRSMGSFISSSYADRSSRNVRSSYIQVTCRVPLAREHFIACADKPAPYIQCAPLAVGRTTIVATASPPPAMSVLFIEISWQGLLRVCARRGVVG